MARCCWALPVPCFSNCSWAECDVDRGRPEVTDESKNSLDF